MALINVKTGFTIHIGHPSNNEYGRCDVEVMGINTELPLEPQMEEVRAAFEGVWPSMVATIDKQATDTLGVQIIRKS